MRSAGPGQQRPNGLTAGVGIVPFQYGRQRAPEAHEASEIAHAKPLVVAYRKAKNVDLLAPAFHMVKKTSGLGLDRIPLGPRAGLPCITATSQGRGLAHLLFE